MKAVRKEPFAELDKDNRRQIAKKTKKKRDTKTDDITKQIVDDHKNNSK